MDLWSRWVDWFLTSDNSKYLPAFKQVGGDDIDQTQGSKIPIYAFLTNGWRIKPQEAHHTLTVTDGVLVVNGGGDPFVNTDGAYTVRINYQQPLQAITVVSGSGLDAGQDATLTSIKVVADATKVVVDAIKVVVDAIKVVTDWLFRWAKADEEKNVQTNKYYKRDEDTSEILVEKDYAKDVNDNETLTKP